MDRQTPPKKKLQVAQNHPGYVSDDSEQKKKMSANFPLWFIVEKCILSDIQAKKTLAEERLKRNNCYSSKVGGTGWACPPPYVRSSDLAEEGIKRNNWLE